MNREYTPEVLRKIQLMQLEILLEVDEICKRNDIKYIISCGTLLGAIRHKGFIPWDDDIDIDMLRPDYERFLEVAKHELSSECFMQNYMTDKHCLNIGFAKIRMNGTIHESEGQKHLLRHKGISMDIFPIDKVPVQPYKRRVHKEVITFIQRLVAIKLKFNYYNEKPIKKVIKLFGSTLLAPISVAHLGALMEKGMKYYENTDSTLVSNVYSKKFYDQCTFDETVYGSKIDIEFEGLKFSGPKMWETYLKQMYGDYMKLPPENERFNFQHNIVNVDIGE